MILTAKTSRGHLPIEGYIYKCDAEVEVEFDSPLDLSRALQGQTFLFNFSDLKKTWTGHLDGFTAFKLHPRETGNAYLCLHNLALSQKNPTPGGQPFGVGSGFTITADQTVIGTGKITRLVRYSKEPTTVCPPLVRAVPSPRFV